MPKIRVDKHGTTHASQVTRTQNPRYIALLEGKLQASDLDLDELMHLQVKMPDGRIRKGSFLIPADMAREMQRQLMSRANDKLRNSIIDAIDVVTGIATDKKADAAHRLKAATYVIDRVLGKTPERVEVSETRKYEIMFKGLEAGSRSERQAQRRKELAVYADAEVVEEGESGV